MGEDVQRISGPVHGVTPLAAARLCNFATGSETPLFGHRFWIESTVKAVCSSSPNPWIDVFAYASHRGSARGYDNQALSERRRNEIIKEIKKHCPNVRFIQQEALGDSQSTGDINDNSGDWRAVSVYVYGALPPGRKPEPVSLPVPTEWFVTQLNLSSFSVVVTLGFNAVWGHIQFEKPNGDKYNCPIGMVGPSLGVSVKTPNVGKLFAKIPGIDTFLGRFPLLSKAIGGDEDKFVERVLLYIWAESPAIRKAIVAFPAVRTLIDKLIRLRASVSASDESWTSKAIGLVSPNGSRTLAKADFNGPCICYAVTGEAAVVGGGLYLLFFGIDRGWSVLSEPTALVNFSRLEKVSKGIALISAASVNLGLPSVGATAFYGEIT